MWYPANPHSRPRTQPGLRGSTQLGIFRASRGCPRFAPEAVGRRREGSGSETCGHYTFECERERVKRQPSHPPVCPSQRNRPAKTTSNCSGLRAPSLRIDLTLGYVATFWTRKAPGFRKGTLTAILYWDPRRLVVWGTIVTNARSRSA